jgi:hypothetical protein
MVFDDTVEHEAWNRSDRPRVVLLLDFKAPGLVVRPGTSGSPPAREIMEWTKFVWANLRRVHGFLPKVKALGHFVARANKR